LSGTGRAGGNQHLPGLKGLPFNLDRSPSGEARLPVKSGDALFCVSLFLFLRDGIGEGPFEGNEIGPADADLACHTPAAHAPDHIERLGALISIFFGSQPRRAQVPPNGRLSMMATDHPAARTRRLTTCAAVPLPMTTRS
jgi:hypothetical protein